MGREKPIKGAVELGEYAIEPNYFEQNQVRCLLALRGSMPHCGFCLFVHKRRCPCRMPLAYKG